METSRKVTSAWEILQSRDKHHPQRNSSLFSSSLPIQVRYVWSEYSGQSVDYGLQTYGKLHQEYSNSHDEIEINAMGSLLPDDEHELLAGVEDDFDLTWLPRQLEDLEDDLFSSVGGIEMDHEPQGNLSTAISKLNFSDCLPAHSISHYGVSNSVSVAAAGEHPYGEHPSRTLFVRNINSNVEDSELRSLFEQYGDIRSLYTACKHRGFVMISYYDIRHARNAMRSLQSTSLRQRKLDIHFSIPKDNPSENEVNQGTLVVFNLDVSVSNDDLHHIFGMYGMVKEIRETPHKRHHRFVEFYDVRDAEAALKGLNKTEIAGKRIKLEPSRPGGARRSLMHKTNQDLEHDDALPFRRILGSPGVISPSGNYSPSGLRSHGNASYNVPGLASIIPSRISDPMKIAPVVIKDHRELFHVTQVSANSRLPGMGYHLSHSFSDQKLGLSPGQASSFGESNYFSSSFETLSSPHFLCGTPHSYSSGSTSVTDHLSTSVGKGHDFLYSDQHKPYLGSNHLHHVGSAPSGVVGERQTGYKMNIGTCPATKSVGFTTPGNFSEIGLLGSRIIPSPVNGPVSYGSCSFRKEFVPYQEQKEEQFQIDLDKIRCCEDTRTTLTIKNVPNKYTSKMLMAAIDKNLKGSYDFFYLPIDLKNKCNMGYAFINMISPSHVISFYEAFNEKQLENFGNGKMGSKVVYARIQGSKSELVSHFQNEDGYFQSKEDEKETNNEVQLLNNNNNSSGYQIHHQSYGFGGPPGFSKIPTLKNGFNVRKKNEN